MLGFFRAKLPYVKHTESPPRPALVLLTLALDIVLVLVFALSGRRSHDETLGAAGVFETAWPFLVALAAGWLICRLWQQPLRIFPHGICLWLITVVGGMALRILSGSTAALPFVVVATLVLALFLLGQRTVTTLVLRRTAKA